MILGPQVSTTTTTQAATTRMATTAVAEASTMVLAEVVPKLVMVAVADCSLVVAS